MNLIRAASPRSSWHTSAHASLAPRLLEAYIAANMWARLLLVAWALAASTGCDPRPDPARPIRGSHSPSHFTAHELVGKRLTEFRFDTWLAGTEAPPSAPAPTLYRWWTDSCAYCEKSLPAIESLRRRFQPRGLRVVAVYHPKPPRDVATASIRASAERLGYHGLIAVDRDWSELSSFYLSTGERPATSASFLVDRAGVIRFVHPGPELKVSDAAYADLEHEIERVLRNSGAATR